MLPQFIWLFLWLLGVSHVVTSSPHQEGESSKLTRRNEGLINLGAYKPFMTTYHMGHEALRVSRDLVYEAMKVRYSRTM